MGEGGTIERQTSQVLKVESAVIESCITKVHCFPLHIPHLRPTELATNKPHAIEDFIGVVTDKVEVAVEEAGKVET